MKKNERSKENSRTAAQTSIAEKSGLAVVVVDENSSALSKANNNSICQILYSSERFAPECDKYCGAAFHKAAQAGETVAYRCYANLDCRAVPIKDGANNETRLVAIVGRVFTNSENYRRAAERAASGDWSEFPVAELFENVLLSASTADLEKAAAAVENLSGEEKAALFEFARRNEEKSAEKSGRTESDDGEETAESVGRMGAAEALPATNGADRIARRNSAENAQIAEWRSLFGSLLDLSYRQACAAILRFLSEQYSLKSLAWLECRENRFDAVCGTGKFENLPMRLGVSTDDARLIEAARAENWLELLERKNGDDDLETPAARLFPVAVGGEIKSGLLLSGDADASAAARRRVGRFCRTVAADLEILRLREELARRGWLARAVRKLNDNLRDIDSEDFWSKLVQVSAELMKAERSSLLLFDEKTRSFETKAAIGAAAERIKNERGESLGARVAKKVLEGGKSLLVARRNRGGAEQFTIPPAPPDWKYASESFISFPIEIGGRKIGVLNFTDKTGGEDYDSSDSDLLGAIVPQMAVLIDRSAMKDKAGEFEQLSVTDALTGLLNRRYLEERLAEEIRRSNRSGFATSFMMIDVDDFKSYNDNFSHPEGDKALKLVAQSLKETLRGADVAARYGGEEFSILLPQTNSIEAAIIAERIRERVEAANFPHRKVTVSVGVASCSQSISTAANIIKAADDALYEAKRSGRNNVRIYENPKKMENG